jgi:prolyl-tRNA synthetase
MTNKNAITPTRAQDFATWYQEVIKAADLAEHSTVRGCMIIKPWGYAIWENIQKALDQMIKDTGHENVYFPMLIPLSLLAKEAEHVEGFAKECAVVTHYRLETNAEGELVPAPEAKLAEPYIIRPTSETVIGVAMASWVKSYKDLPVLLNQWANVMRWEMRTRLFLRTSEFLWQEGHTAHATRAEAIDETLKMLDVYEKLAFDYLAIPVIKGEKTPSERFPGAVNTYCIEAIMQDGKALQAGTSHFLGQNFSKAYDIKYADREQQISYAWTTSWGCTTRLIGALILSHSDDDGLVLPPRIAPIQITLLPVVMNDADQEKIFNYCDNLAKELAAQTYFGEKIRVKVDKSEQRAGMKFWGAVKKGIPVRLEIGMRELEMDSVAVSLRSKPAKDKVIMSRQELLATTDSMLEEVHQTIWQKALEFRNNKTITISSLTELEKLFANQEEVQDANSFALCYFDVTAEANPDVVETLKRLKLTARCLPFAEQSGSGACIFTGKTVNSRVIFARAY